MKPWKRYVDDTITYIKTDSIMHVLDILNSQNIKFTYELESNGKIFLDALLMRIGSNLETRVFHKKTNNDIYIGNRLLLLRGK